jgi:hypothetical protein
MAQGFAQALNLTCAESPLTPRELSLAGQLRDQKYTTEKWNARV